MLFAHHLDLIFFTFHGNAVAMKIMLPEQNIANFCKSYVWTDICL